MIIDSTEKEIFIDTQGGQLKPYQLSQLDFYGFVFNSPNQVFRTVANDTDILLVKLLAYLDGEGISYELTKQCESKVSSRKLIMEKLNDIKATSQSFKEGNFDKQKFNEFAAFVKKNIKRKLRDHQVKAAFHLYISKNAANFSVPGSGKTSVVITVYEKLRLENKVNILFVIGPPSCFGPWKAEFYETLGRVPSIRILSGIEPDTRKIEYYKPNEERAELYLITFQTFLNDQSGVGSLLKSHDAKPFLVVDEAHYIKQLNGSWAKSVLNVSQYAPYRCVLTGTPIPKSYSDIFNLFDFLWGDSQVLNSEDKTKIDSNEKNHEYESAKSILKEKVGPFFYRVRKSDLGLLPPVFCTPDVVAMNKYEGMLYKAIENKIRDFAKNDYLKNIDLIEKLYHGRIVRLRQCCSYPKLLSTVVEGYEEDITKDSEIAAIIMDYDTLEKPAKLSRLDTLVKSLRVKSQKVVIWSNFIGTLELIMDHFKNSGMESEIIYGKTPVESTGVKEELSREEIRDRFIDPQSGLDILVANPAACAESISLHKTCFHAIYYDLSYNCAQYLQSLDRIHRIGGSENNVASYHFLQYADTIELDIKNNLDQKARKMYDLIEEDYTVYSLNMFENDDSEAEAFKRLFGS